MKKFKIYLDCCCFNRPFDDLSYDKIRIESEAILTIIAKCEDGIWNIYKSDILEDEIDRIINPVKRQKVCELYRLASLEIKINKEIIDMAKEFQNKELEPFDALHLASAEYSGADVLLTTDAKFLNRASQIDTKIKIYNPVIWLLEVLYNDV